MLCKSGAPDRLSPKSGPQRVPGRCPKIMKNEVLQCLASEVSIFLKKRVFYKGVFQKLADLGKYATRLHGSICFEVSALRFLVVFP